MTTSLNSSKNTASNMNRRSDRYHIIDEPKPRAYEHLIVNPIVILLVGILLPLIWQAPFYGRVWIPLLWALINGYMLGSHSFKSEFLIGVAGAILWFSLPYLVYITLTTFNASEIFDAALPYIQIANQGVFFLTLYLIVFKQMLAYELHNYLKENRR